MAFRQSEHRSVGEQQVILIVVQRLRQSSRSLKREMRAAKDVLVSLLLGMRLIAPTRDDQKCIALRRTGVVERLFEVRLADFFFIPFVNVSHHSRPKEQFLDGYLIEP